MMAINNTVRPLRIKQLLDARKSVFIVTAMVLAPAKVAVAFLRCIDVDYDSHYYRDVSILA